MPSDYILLACNRAIESIFDNIVDKIKETQSLIKTRDTLLPKLMSGEIINEKMPHLKDYSNKEIKTMLNKLSYNKLSYNKLIKKDDFQLTDEDKFSNFVIFQTEKGKVNIDVFFYDETLWLTQIKEVKRLLSDKE